LSEVPAIELPPSAAWRHVDARDGFEVMFALAVAGGYRLAGHTAAVEDGQAWSVGYEIVLDDTWRTMTAHVWSRSASGDRQVHLAGDGAGRWSVDGVIAEHLDGCLDVDLESSACTNTLPVHRLRLGVGDRAGAPAAYVRSPDLGVERLEQEYVRVDDDGTRQRYDYASPAFDFAGRLVYDDAGLVLDYPGIAQRVA
jgi:hypothetical protein